jgi:hypothetical protein
MMAYSIGCCHHERDGILIFAFTTMSHAARSNSVASLNNQRASLSILYSELGLVNCQACVENW